MSQVEKTNLSVKTFEYSPMPIRQRVSLFWPICRFSDNFVNDILHIKRDSHQEMKDVVI